jgi:hypothetical protein
MICSEVIPVAELDAVACLRDTTAGIYFHDMCERSRMRVTTRT